MAIYIVKAKKTKQTQSSLCFGAREWKGNMFTYDFLVDIRALLGKFEFVDAGDWALIGTVSSSEEIWVSMTSVFLWAVCLPWSHRLTCRWFPLYVCPLQPCQGRINAEKHKTQNEHNLLHTTINNYKNSYNPNISGALETEQSVVCGQNVRPTYWAGSPGRRDSRW